FTTGTTEALNLVAYGWAEPRIEEGDEILLTVMEHHANIVPWHFLRERHGAVLKWVEPAADGSLDAQTVIDAITDRTKLIAVTHMSNVLGTVVDVKAICAAARAKNICTVIDGSQAAVHMPVNVADIDCDFYAVTGHKLYGPSGSGALYINRRRHDETRPFKGGGDMIRDVGRDAVSYGDAPFKFEAGTPPIVQITALGTALDYMTDVGMENIAAHEAALRDHARERFAGLNWLNIQGDAPGKGAIFSFTIEGAGHAHDISTVVDRKGVAVRAGHHCAQPLMQHLGVTATCRASFGMYNTTDEVDILVDALETCHKLFS
ncbi:MAG: cysteine desulfurase, partial [Pseudomonadota bacterium]